MAADADDLVLAKRDRIRSRVQLGKRVGYSLYAYAVIAFVVGAVAGFSEPLVTSIVVAMGIGAVLLIPAIVFGYGIKAAERDERETVARQAAAREAAARQARPPSTDESDHRR